MWSRQHGHEDPISDSLLGDPVCLSMRRTLIFNEVIGAGSRPEAGCANSNTFSGVAVAVMTLLLESVVFLR